jgi:hypothetical protein
MWLKLEAGCHVSISRPSQYLSNQAFGSGDVQGSMRELQLLLLVLSVKLAGWAAEDRQY